MHLTLEKMIITGAWIPTLATYVMGDINGALIFSGANVVVILMYVCKDRIRSNTKLLRLLNKIF